MISSKNEDVHRLLSRSFKEKLESANRDNIPGKVMISLKIILSINHLEEKITKNLKEYFFKRTTNYLKMDYSQQGSSATIRSRTLSRKYRKHGEISLKTMACSQEGGYDKTHRSSSKQQTLIPPQWLSHLSPPQWLHPAYVSFTPSTSLLSSETAAGLASVVAPLSEVLSSIGTSLLSSSSSSSS